MESLAAAEAAAAEAATAAAAGAGAGAAAADDLRRHAVGVGVSRQPEPVRRDWSPASIHGAATAQTSSPGRGSSAGAFGATVASHTVDDAATPAALSERAGVARAPIHLCAKVRVRAFGSCSWWVGSAAPGRCSRPEGRWIRPPVTLCPQIWWSASSSVQARPGLSGAGSDVLNADCRRCWFWSRRQD